MKRNCKLSHPEWIDSFVDCMSSVDGDADQTVVALMAEEYWAFSAHREPADVVQDLLIERYLQSGGMPPKDPPESGVS